MRTLSRARRRNSILFVRPDYHCTFFYQSELEKLGWRADIFVPWGYPEHLLYRDSDIIRPPSVGKYGSPGVRKVINHILSSIWYLGNGWKYRYHLYYGPPPVWLNLLTPVTASGTPGLSLKLAQLWGCKLLFLPTGCREEHSKRDFELLDNGAVCGNCGFWDRCNDKENMRNFSVVRKYFDRVIGNGSSPESQFATRNIKWKSINLELWSPELTVPPDEILPPTNAVRILHSFSSNGRSFEGRNIKGSPFVKKAVDRLISEGYDVELLYLTDVPSNKMRFYQVQADIIVEQLHYGWWGSTGVEAMALGKPVVCYLRQSWKEHFFDNFPNYTSLPIVEANVNDIYSVLKSLVLNPQLRREAGKNSRAFAIQHFDPAINAREFEELLLDIE